MAALNFPASPALNEMFTSGGLSWVWDGDRWVPVADPIPGTDLAYIAATRVLSSSTGADATLPLVTSSEAGLAPASGGGTSNFLRADGTWTAPSGGSSYVEPGASRFVAFNDFGSVQATSDWILNGQGSGNSATAISSPDGTGIGWVTLSTGTTTTGRIRSISPRMDMINLANGDVRFRGALQIVTLSDDTDTYTARAGLIDSDVTETTDGAFFRYTHSVNGGKWQAVTRAGLVETSADTGVTVAINTSYAMDVRVVSGVATFYIDGLLVATISTNIPSGSAQATGYGFFMQKTAGTNPRLMNIDYGWCEQIMTGRL